MSIMSASLESQVFRHFNIKICSVKGRSQLLSETALIFARSKQKKRFSKINPFSEQDKLPQIPQRMINLVNLGDYRNSIGLFSLIL